MINFGVIAQLEAGHDMINILYLHKIDLDKTFKQLSKIPKKPSANFGKMKELRDEFGGDSNIHVHCSWNFKNRFYQEKIQFWKYM